VRVRIAEARSAEARYSHTMFWADKIVEEIKKKYKNKIVLQSDSGQAKNEAIIIRDEKTASGRIHVGSLRGVAIHGIISEVLSEENIKNKYLYEINDFDPMDGMPVYLDRETFLPHMGKPLCDVPSPDGKEKNYAEYFAQEFIEVIKSLGFEPEFYRSSDLYKSGKYNEAIKIVLENADKIRQIYKRVSGAEKEKGWLPINIVCRNCGKIGTTLAISFDGKEVEYVCEENEKNLVEWVKGCGYRGKVSPFDGNAKLPWKVEWAAKFTVLGVDVEGAGKDHATKGGAREVADAISLEIFKRNPPFDVQYEFFQVGGRKMSSSKGAGSSAKEIIDLLPPELARFLFLHKEPRQVIDFVPDGDTIPVLYDTYDKMAQVYFSDAKGDYKRVFYLSHTPKQRENGLAKRFLPRFSQVAFLVQMPHANLSKEIEKIKADKLTDEDEYEVEYRARYAVKWLSLFAPEDHKFELQEKEIPSRAKKLNDIQKQALKAILDYVSFQEILDGQALHEKIHEIKSELGIDPRELFSAVYLSFLGKESGPKAGWFLSVLDKDFMEKRLREVTGFV